MKKEHIGIFLFLSFCLIFIGATSGENVSFTDMKNISQLKEKPEVKGKLKAYLNFGKIPLYFIYNKGQVNKRALFYAKTPGYTLWVTKEGLVFDSVKHESKTNSKFEILNSKLKNKTGSNSEFKIQNSKLSYRDISRLIFQGSNKNVEILPLKKQKLKVNYFKGNDKSKWVGSVPTSGAVLYKNLYKNIDLKVYGIGKQIEYDWIVNPGGDPSDIKFEYKNIKEISINKSGDLDITTQFGTLVHKKPYAYQKQEDRSKKSGEKIKFEMRSTKSETNSNDQNKKEIKANFKKIDKTTFGFFTGKYDKTKPLIIDPVVLVYSTYLGGGDDDYGYGIAADNNGIVYVTGETSSTDFPILNHYQEDQENIDVFVTKIDTTLSGANSLLYSTYLGGGSGDYGRAIAADNNGYVYVTGKTVSSDFPTLNGYQSTLLGNEDAFVTKLDTTLSGANSLLYSTYLGGISWETGKGIAVDNNGYVYVTGNTWSSDFPISGGYQTTFQGGSYDAFVTKIDTTQSGTDSLLYSTYLGGDDSDYAGGIAVDNNGYVYVTGYTKSTNFPTLNEYQGDQDTTDVFVTKLDTTLSGASSLLYSTYLGGNQSDYGKGIAADNNEYVYVTGHTNSTDFPILNQYQGDQDTTDVFVTKLDTTESGENSLLYSTYLGGNWDEGGLGIAVDNNEHAYVTGIVYSTDFPTLNEYQGDQDGFVTDGFVTKLDTTEIGGNSLLYSTYLGGSSDDYGRAIAVDNNGYVYVTGETESSDFPSLNGYQGNQGITDAFVTKLVLGYDINSSVTGGNGIVSPATQSIHQGNNATITITPDSGYEIDTITDNLISQTISNPYVIYNVQEGHDVVITFKVADYNINSLVSGGNGIVSPATQSILHGDNATITITPNSGYDIDTIIDNGVSQAIANPYIINNVQEDHTVVVTFRDVLFDVTASVSGGGGSVSPPYQQIDEGNNATITITPNPGNSISSITDNGVLQPVVNPYIINNVQEDHNVVVTFNIITFKVTASVSGGNGNVSPASQTINEGDNASITIAPNTGYEIASIVDNGVSQPITNPYSINNIRKAHNVIVTFRNLTYSPTLSLSGERRTERAWIISKDYTQLTIEITEHPQFPTEVSKYSLYRNVNGSWAELISYSSAGTYNYTDKYLDKGESARYKLIAISHSGTNIAETSLEL